MGGPTATADHSEPVAPPPRRRRRLLWAALAGALLVAAGAIAAVVGTGGSSHPRSAAAEAPSTRSTRHRHHAVGTTTTIPVTTTTTGAPTTTSTTGPGTLPQTTTLPSATSPQFRTEMADLWQGVLSGSAGPAMPAFFPLGAYLQLKTIPDARQDWQYRLVGDFSLDLHAAHALVGTGAKLVGVDVPTQYAHWVVPGTCDNSIGYYEVPNARVVFEVGGTVRSFGIASMISWRGVWYVVHLGAVLRSTPREGIVDAPATGPGTPAYSSTC